MKDIRILMAAWPGGDLGPAVGYANHRDALNQGGFQLTELTQAIWDDPNSFRGFDVVWAYTRFHPDILARCQQVNIPLIGGPNIVMERADAGISDEWEKWYLEQSKVILNLNVADYYVEHVRKFATSIGRCETLEYCHDVDAIPDMSWEDRPNEVLVYVKDRVNDGAASDIAKRFCELLEQNNVSYKTLVYGNYSRSEYLELCSESRVTAWLSIEDYCSLAQMESHLNGSCVIGTPYNLTIPAVEEAVCENSQTMKDWVCWNDHQQVADDYFAAYQRLDSIPNLAVQTISNAKHRHSFETYQNRTRQLLEHVLRRKDDRAQIFANPFRID